MKKIYNILLVSLFCLFIAGCSDDDEKEKLSVTVDQYAFPAKGGTGTITVSSPNTVQASSDKDWCTVSVAGKIVSFELAKSEALESRNARITVRSDGEIAHIEISQEGTILWLQGIDDIVKFGYAGGSVTGKSRVNTDFKTESEGWIHFSVNEFGEFTISTDPNPDIGERSGSLKVWIEGTVLEKTYTIRQTDEIQIPKDLWSVPEYDEASDDATKGYSSQAVNEGGVPNGRVAAVFDGSPSTYWHTRWTSSKPIVTFPHWFIIDMSKNFIIQRVEVIDRHSDSAGQVKHKFLTCTQEGAETATDPADPDTWPWEDQGTYTFVQSTVLGFIQNYPLAAKPKARYFKYYVDASMKGTKDQAVVAEITMFGREVE